MYIMGNQEKTDQRNTAESRRKVAGNPWDRDMKEVEGGSKLWDAIKPEDRLVHCYIPRVFGSNRRE